MIYQYHMISGPAALSDKMDESATPRLRCDGIPIRFRSRRSTSPPARPARPSLRPIPSIRPCNPPAEDAVCLDDDPGSTRLVALITTPAPPCPPSRAASPPHASRRPVRPGGIVLSRHGGLILVLSKRRDCNLSVRRKWEPLAHHLSTGGGPPRSITTPSLPLLPSRVAVLSPASPPPPTMARRPCSMTERRVRLKRRCPRSRWPCWP